MRPYELPIEALSDEIRQGQLSPSEVLESFLSRIDLVEPRIHAIAHLDAENAKAQAAVLDDELIRGNYRGPLHGVPITVKDIIDVAGCPSGCNSQHRRTYYPEADATVIRRLREAGAVIVGKAQTHEFASGVTTAPTRNPWNPDCIPGGSSGGSGASVSSGECAASIGTDTGGSIRIPAALCGVVGYKPTYGLLPRSGVASLSWSFDTIGPLARSVYGAAVTAEAMAGPDYADPASANVSALRLAEDIDAGVSGLRIGVPTNLNGSPAQPAVVDGVEKALMLLRNLGAVVTDIELPEAELIYPASLLAIELPEATSYHLERLETQADLFGDDVRALYELGRHVPATSYVNAQRVRRRLQITWQEALKSVDVLVMPTVPAEAVPIGEFEVAWPDSSESIFDLYVRTSAPASFMGMPAISLPAGLSADGLPVGVQLIAKPFHDAQLLQIARSLEAAIEFPRVVPDGRKTATSSQSSAQTSNSSP